MELLSSIYNIKIVLLMLLANFSGIAKFLKQHCVF